MTRLLEEALEAVRKLSPDAQDAVAKVMMLAIAEDGEHPEDWPAEHAGAIREGLDQLDRGEFASDERVAAAWRRFDR